jgi:hypothetical protein
MGRLRTGFKVPAHGEKREHPQAVPWFIPHGKPGVDMGLVMDILMPHNPHVADWDPAKWERVPPKDGTALGPTVVPITLPMDDCRENGWDDLFPQWYKCYRSGVLVCKGDGERVVHRVIKGSDEVIDLGEDGESLICNPPLCHAFTPPEPAPGEKKQSKLCKEVGELSFFLRGYPGFEVFMITTRKTSILNINTALMMMRAKYGTLCGLPALLTVAMEDFVVEGKARRAPILHLITDPGADYSKWTGAAPLALDSPAPTQPPLAIGVEAGAPGEGPDASGPVCAVCPGNKQLTSAEVDRCIANTAPGHVINYLCDECWGQAKDELPF